MGERYAIICVGSASGGAMTWKVVSDPDVAADTRNRMAVKFPRHVWLVVGLNN